ncbi:hypothetical protein [Kitasatospora cheerisanensis]|uniref:Uncharacterized protein n=1 Tax=Kitasatospora cheerisanensis KCTC 2395 TaxID=1348663 RepID=A0A066YJA7_9ACTN|nr:hypothetical protein [Kitasatospora cheerisanensis]KDN81573.1 hypothetical protein KCH_66750 [Kitasatospora cheerisanensis KCTC 2395]
MSLLVHTFVRRPDGDWELLEDPPYGRTLAGFERTRTHLWGSAPVRALGARFLPRLATTDLLVDHPDLDAFLTECATLRTHHESLATQCGCAPDYLTARLDNITAAAHRAKSEPTGGVLIW